MTIRQLLDEAAQNYPELPAMEYRLKNGGVASIPYSSLLARVREVSEVAGEAGLAPCSDIVGLMLENRPEWIELYLGLVCCGITVIPMDPKLKPEEAEYILGDAKAAGIITTPKHKALVEKVVPSLPSMRTLFWVDANGAPPEIAGKPSIDIAARRAAVAAKSASDGSFYLAHKPADGDLASVIYTSGTTGNPKGAMITHDNFCCDALFALNAVPGFSHEARFLIVLPLFHAFCFTANLVVPLRLGARMQFAESLRTLGEDFRTLKPTLMMGVPLLLEKLLEHIKENVRKSPAARFLNAVGLGCIVRRQIRMNLGGLFNMFVTGGAPCSVGMIRDYRKLGITVIEGYGLTECSPIVSVTSADRSRPGTIGTALPGIEVRVDNPNSQGVGELLVRGPIVMKGYLGKEEATKEAFTEDGWLRTGDLVTIDKEGYLAIRGRAKALIVNREGKNIYPEEVELRLANDPLIHDFLVLGVHEPGVTGEKVGAIIVPDIDAFKEANGGVEPAWEKIDEIVRKRLQKACAKLADYKHPRVIEVRREPLERTAAQKIRRHIYNGALDGK